MRINIYRGNSTKSYYNNQNINNPSTKSSYYSYLTHNNQNNPKKINPVKRNYSQNNSNINMNNEEKREITIDEMTNFILEKKKEKKNQNNLKC